MAKEDTLEVDPSELSDGVFEELVDEAEIDRDDATEMAEDVHMQEMDIREPVSNNALESGLMKYKKLRGWLGELYDMGASKTAKPVIKNVSPNENGVEITITHPKIHRRSVNFGPDSVKLANLMSYHGADNPSELEGERLVLSKISALNQTNSSDAYTPVEILFPNNVSAHGRTRYKIFSFLQDVRSKSKYWTSYPADEITITYGLCFFISVLIAGVGAGVQDLGIELGISMLNNIAVLLTFPLLIFLLCGLATVSYLGMRLVTFVMYAILKGVFEEEEI